jgi:molecular chaperone GrpE
MRQGYKLGDYVLRHAMVGVVDSVEEPSDVDAAAVQAEVQAD